MNSSKMTPEERGSLPPRPPGHSAGPLPASAPKRRFVKLGRKPSDDGSVKSGSSGCSTKSESVGVALRQPSRSRIRRHTNRLSGVFQRGPASSLAQPMALTSDTSSSSFPAYTRKDSLTPGDPTDDPSELSNQITAPGILKIFGSEICEGANYKSVLATTHSSAKELVKEALDRYGLNKEEAESYVLCDAIGHVGGHQWRTECFRVVCDNEKPLLLQALWKPREGLARRFEIQRRSAVEEKRSREKDTITAGINAQARKLQKSRSRVNSTLSERVSCRAQGLWRSLSEVDLTDQAGGYALKDSRENLGHEEEEPERNYEENQEENADRHPKQHRKENVKQNPSVLFEVDGGSERLENGEMERAMTGREKSGRVQEGGEREEREGEERESSDDNVTQFSFHPPHHCPYLLLLQGHSLKQDFVINLLSGSSTVIGRRREDGERSSADLLLSAPDILPRHCCLRRYSNRRSTRLHLFDGAVVTRNGMVVSKGAELASGDVIGLGQHYMFLFKDPTALAVMHKDPVAASSVERPLTSAPQLPSQATAPPPPSPPTGVTLLCSTCTSALTGPQTSRGPRRATPYLKDAGGRDLTLPYHAEYEQRIVREIVAAGSGGKDRPPLAVAFLLCACVQHAATHLLSSDLRRLLLLIAGQVQSAMWEHTKELAASQPEVDTQELPALAMPELLSGLRPLVVWMSNALELLQFIQHQLPHLLAWRSHPDQGEGPEGDREVQDEASMALLEMRLSCVRSASEETMTVLEEVIMLTFQQCVYYITKALYPLLPGLLDSHPSRGSSEPRLPGRGGPFLGSGGPLVPGETEQVLEVLTETRQLLQSCQVHRDLCSQLLAYLFYFINASLLNTLMERGSEAGFYQWARGVSIRVNLDLLLDWAHRSGLGELALEHTHTLSSAVNLLATPTQNLVQASWTSLRSEFSALSPAQMHHLLRGYTPPPPCPDRWGPTPQEERAALNTADILESFDSHPPLALPDGGFRLDLSRAVKDPALVEQLDWLRRVVSGLSESPFPGNAAGEASLQYSTAVPLEAKITKMAAHPKASLESLETPPAEVVLPPELLLLQGPCPPSPPLTRGPTSCGLGSCGDLLAQKLQSLELQSREAGGCGDDGLRRSALDPSCLLTPPNTPHNLEPVEPETEHLNGDVRGGLQPPLTRMSSLDQHGHADVLEEGCLSADRTGNGIILGEDEEEEEGDEGEVFILELQRGARGLGLALVDARDSQLRASGIFIRAVIPDSPAARSQKLGPGDRILAVNGVSLVGLDYQSGHELIRSSGERPRLLVARSDWTTKTIQTQ